LTGDQHKDNILTGQRESRPDVFYFFPNRTFLKTILASGTFGFARYTGQRFAKPKEPLFSQRTDNIYESLSNLPTWKQ
jgi:hypothetical protein